MYYLKAISTLPSTSRIPHKAQGMVFLEDIAMWLRKFTSKYLWMFCTLVLAFKRLDVSYHLLTLTNYLKKILPNTTNSFNTRNHKKKTFLLTQMCPLFWLLLSTEELNIISYFKNCTYQKYCSFSHKRWSWKEKFNRQTILESFKWGLWRRLKDEGVLIEVTLWSPNVKGFLTLKEYEKSAHGIYTQKSITCF